MQLCAVVNHALIVKRLPLGRSNFINTKRGMAYCSPLSLINNN